jgi:hypothetical protein
MGNIEINDSSEQIGLIPESELTLHTEPYKSRLSEAIAWAEQNAVQISELKEFATNLE